MSLQIPITANGTAHAVTSGATIGDFLRERGLKPGLVVVEHNGQPLTPGEPDHVQLRNGDRLEIVRIVAGG
jgi:thiamine biosynthesis protein ThiS